MRLLLAQMNPTVGDIPGNCAQILSVLEKARASKNPPDCIIFPEQALFGYPSDDLLLSSEFLTSLETTLNQIIKATLGLNVIIGTVRRCPACEDEKPLRNTAAICVNGVCIGFQDKTLLPNYGVFRERRYFSGDREPLRLWPIAGKKVAVTICEDIWQYGSPDLHYPRDPIYPLKNLHPDLVVNLSASPYYLGREAERLVLCQKIAHYVNAPVALCNQVGANDGLIFDGSSLVVSAKGECLAAGPFCESALIEVDTTAQPILKKESLDEDEALFSALVMGVKDYFHKTGHKKACIGLSGGIDSALTACIATQALGSENVTCVAMPSRFSSAESLRDAKALANALHVSCLEIPIEEPFSAFCGLLRPKVDEKSSGLMEENIQSRIRGTLLMSLANANNALVLATGNKSEFAMGYTTLYGDLCGALAVLGDLTKWRVYALARYINREGEVIPQYTIDRPPSAELRPNQLDSDTLPDYAILDGVVEDLIEKKWTCIEVAERRQIPLALVESIANTIYRNEYKRRQAPIILRVTTHCFGVGRQMPVSQGFRVGSRIVV